MNFLMFDIVLRVQKYIPSGFTSSKMIKQPSPQEDPHEFLVQHHLQELLLDIFTWEAHALLDVRDLPSGEAPHEILETPLE